MEATVGDQRRNSDSVSHGSSARSVTSVAARVKVESQQPNPPTRSGSCAIMRCAASFAFSAESPVSYCRSVSLAPPSDLMPPALLMSSIASSRADLLQDALARPWTGQRHQHGDLHLLRRACARARRGAIAAAPVARPRPSAVRRPIEDVFVIVAVSHAVVAQACGQPEIGPADPVVGEQCLIGSVEHHVAGFQHIAVVGQFQRLGDTLLDQQDGDAVLAVDLRYAFEDRVGDRGREAHRRFVEHQQLRRRGQPASDRHHLLLTARQSAGKLSGALGEDWKQRVDAFERVRASARVPPWDRRPSRGFHAP